MIEQEGKPSLNHFASSASVVIKIYKLLISELNPNKIVSIIVTLKLFQVNQAS